MLSLALAVSSASAAAEPPIEVRGLLDQWLAAQNRGDFGTYSALYSARFGGLRRSGVRTARFDRTGWLRDRQRMFNAPMSVSIEKLQGFGEASEWVVQFEQHFVSGSYEDVGPKQMIWRREPEGWRIRSEVMHGSAIKSQSGVHATPRERFAWVVEDGVQLSNHPKWEWGQGVGERVGDVYKRAVRVNELPDSLRSWLGRKVRLFDDKKERCEAAITGFQLLKRAQIDNKNDHELLALSRRAAAESFWGLGGDDGQSLLGTLDQPCKGALWARDASLPLPEIWEIQKASIPLAKRARTALRESRQCKIPDPEHRPLCKETKISVQTMHGRSHGQEVTLISANLVLERPSWKEGEPLWGLWKIEGAKQSLRLVPISIEPLEMEPTSVVDLDGDGQPEFLIDGAGNIDPNLNRVMVRKQGAEWQLVEELNYPFIGCPY